MLPWFYMKTFWHYYIANNTSIEIKHPFQPKSLIFKSTPPPPFFFLKRNAIFLWYMLVVFLIYFFDISIYLYALTKWKPEWKQADACKILPCLKFRPLMPEKLTLFSISQIRDSCWLNGRGWGIVNPLVPGKFEWHFRYLIFQIISVINGWGISCELALRWMLLDLTDDKSTLVLVMAWCRQATSHYLNQCWPRSLPPYGVTIGPNVNSRVLMNRWRASTKRIWLIDTLLFWRSDSDITFCDWLPCHCLAWISVNIRLSMFVDGTLNNGARFLALFLWDMIRSLSYFFSTILTHDSIYSGITCMMIHF